MRQSSRVCLFFILLHSSSSSEQIKLCARRQQSYAIEKKKMGISRLIHDSYDRISLWWKPILHGKEYLDVAAISKPDQSMP